MATGTPGGAVAARRSRRRPGSVMIPISDSQASRISSALSMLRQTWARSGRWRRCSAVALSTTSQPSRSPAATASSTVADVHPLPQLDAVAAEQLAQLVVGEVAPSGRVHQDLVDQPLGAPRGRCPRARPAESSWRCSHAAYSTTRASARTAASTAGYDGTEPRPAVWPARSGTRSSSGTPSRAEEGRDQRLVGLLADRGQHVGDLLAAGVERRDVDRDHRVDVGRRRSPRRARPRSPRRSRRRRARSAW